MERQQRGDQLVLRDVLGVLPPMAVLLAVCVRTRRPARRWTPRPAWASHRSSSALASGFAGMFTSMFSQPDVPP